MNSADINPLPFNPTGRFNPTPPRSQQGPSIQPPIQLPQFGQNGSAEPQSFDVPDLSKIFGPSPAALPRPNVAPSPNTLLNTVNAGPQGDFFGDQAKGQGLVEAGPQGDFNEENPRLFAGFERQGDRGSQEIQNLFRNLTSLDPKMRQAAQEQFSILNQNPQAAIQRFGSNNVDDNTFATREDQAREAFRSQRQDAIDTEQGRIAELETRRREESDRKFDLTKNKFEADTAARAARDKLTAEHRAGLITASELKAKRDQISSDRNHQVRVDQLAATNDNNRLRREDRLAEKLRREGDSQRLKIAKASEEAQGLVNAGVPAERAIGDTAAKFGLGAADLGDIQPQISTSNTAIEGRLKGVDQGKLLAALNKKHGGTSTSFLSRIGDLTSGILGGAVDGFAQSGGNPLTSGLSAGLGAVESLANQPAQSSGGQTKTPFEILGPGGANLAQNEEQANLMAARIRRGF